MNFLENRRLVFYQYQEIIWTNNNYEQTLNPVPANTFKLDKPMYFIEIESLVTNF